MRSTDRFLRSSTDRKNPCLCNRNIDLLLDHLLVCSAGTGSAAARAPSARLKAGNAVLSTP
eukprot:14335319-Heterocapsa_arctica.AAC.1